MPDWLRRFGLRTAMGAAAGCALVRSLMAWAAAAATGHTAPWLSVRLPWAAALAAAAFLLGEKGWSVVLVGGSLLPFRHIWIAAVCAAAGAMGRARHTVIALQEVWLGFDAPWLDASLLAMRHWGWKLAGWGLWGSAAAAWAAGAALRRIRSMPAAPAWIAWSACLLIVDLLLRSTENGRIDSLSAALLLGAHGWLRLFRPAPLQCAKRCPQRRPPESRRSQGLRSMSDRNPSD